MCQIGLEALGIAAIAGASVYEGVAGYQQGQQTKALDEYNAKITERTAKEKEQEAIFKSKRQAEAAEREMSSMRAGLGASGAVTTAGTPLMIQAKQASELELENLMIGYESDVEQQGLKQQAAGYRLEGKYAAKRGTSALIGGLLGAGGSLLKGFTPKAPGSLTDEWGGGPTGGYSRSMIG